MTYDILIKSGSILDGTGSSITFGDIGIVGDRIEAIENNGKTSARITINAYGKYVTPGFIDITNHSDTHLTLFTYPNLESLIMQGVTTIIGGNCGASLAPLATPTAINAISKWVDPTQANINWSRMGEFLDSVDAFHPAVNFGTFVGYGTLRRGVIGDEIRTLTPEEREKIKLLLHDAMKEGAMGLSLGLAYGHERISSTEEIIAIAQVLQKTGGIIAIHLRSEGAELLASVNEAVLISRELRVPIHISHLKAIGKKSWPSLKKSLDLIENAKASGVDITFDVSPYNTTGSLLYLLIPGWARQGGFKELFRKIDDPTEHARIIDALKKITLHYDRILITSAKTKTIVGHTLTEIAEEGGLTPEEALLSTIRANEGRVTMLGRTISKKNTELEIEYTDSMITSDGAGFSQDAAHTGNIVHPRSFGAFPHFWHQFATEHPEQAITKLTALPARRLGLARRGILQKGNYADIVIFDQKLFRDRATHRNPFRYPAGMEWVLINGKPVVENGQAIGIRAGKALRKT